jgi:para-nitrobenzyl esterase
MPAARGLFQRAVIQSGPGLEAKTAADATALARSALRRLGIAPSDADALATVPVDRLIEVQLEEEEAHANADVFRRVSLERNPMLFTWQPVCDGVVLPQQPVASRALAESPDVPVLIGSNLDELSFMGYEDPRFGHLEWPELQAMAAGWFGSESERVLAAYARARPDATPTEVWTAVLTDGIMWSGSIELAERRAALARAPVFMYLFTYQTPVLGSALKSVHGLELPFVFHALDRYPMAGDRDDRFGLAEVMSEAWVSFARRGDPGHGGLPDWPAYSAAHRSTMVLDVQPAVVDDPARELRELWLARTTSFEVST